jgi:uncharacterized protein (TIRG00374 family)
VSQKDNKTHTWFLWVKRLGKLLLVVIPLLLLGWVFQQVPFDQAWGTLQQLDIAQLGVWLVLNLGLVLLMTLRWWLILRVLGYPLPILTLARYRLGSFAISYFTPGPQFGGEPFQVLALRQRHQVSATTGTASVSLDKLFELIANFSFLVFGVMVALSGTWLPEEWRGTGMFLAIGLLTFPLAYLIMMLTGRQPLCRLIDQLPQQMGTNKFGRTISEIEREMSRFCVDYPTTVLSVSLVSLGIWVGLVFEYWLITRFLGLQLSLFQAITALVAARLAFLTPLPGGLGALEASQVLALQTLGLAPSYGISIALLIRMRDILFGAVGLLGIVHLFGWRLPIETSKTKDV